MAVTGEIREDGTVGVIGGIAQKVSTVKRNGVKVFLYPAATPEKEQAEMRAIAGDDVELVPVATLAEAVEHLAPRRRRGAGCAPTPAGAEPATGSDPSGTGPATVDDRRDPVGGCGTVRWMSATATGSLP